jgi:hypothetical protein
MATIASFKSTVLRNILTDLSVSSFSVSFPSDDIALIPCTIVANATAGVVNLNTTSGGLYTNPELMLAAFEIADFILKYADTSAGTIVLTIGAGWQSTNVVPVDRVTLAAAIDAALL